MPKPPSQAPNTQVTPAPVLEKRMRRTYKTEYEMKIIAQTDA
jgi:transposase